MTSNVVVVYDLDRLRTNPRQPGAGQAALEPTYPRDAVGRPTDQGHRVANEADRHEIMPVGFLWTANERRVVFLDRTGQTTSRSLST